MKHITVSLTNSAQIAHVPLAALGYALRRAHVLDPLNEVALPIKTISHTPGEKLVEGLVLILSGGRSTAQADLLLRPNRALAQAWGQLQFAQQSTLADTLDAFQSDNLAELRTAFEAIMGQWSPALAHDFRTGLLFVDDDLTGLPASRHAEGSTKGYFAGEKTVPVDKSRASAPRRMAKPWGRYYSPVLPTV